MAIEDVLNALNSARLRATYGAVAEFLSVHPRSVARLLGNRRPKASWVVNSKTELPSGYAPSEIHPNLLDNARIIRTAVELSDLIAARQPGKSKSDVPNDDVRLVGVDLAWNCSKNRSGLAIGRHTESGVLVESARAEVLGSAAIASLIGGLNGVRGVAVDAPLIVKNRDGGRRCEQELSACYGSRWAGAHRTNLQTPWQCGIELERELQSRGFQHLAAGSGLWQIECYPHPAIIEIFGLPKRLKYKQKKGMSADDVRRGQIDLARHLASLKDSDMLPLRFADSVFSRLDASYIFSLVGAQLKQNEDLLDAILCLYIAGLFHMRVDAKIFGDVDSGYIYVPTPGSDLR